MGEGPQDADRSQPVTRLTVSEAAAVLGISVEAVRGRIKRGTIEYEREGDRVYILVGGDKSSTGRDQGGDQPQPVGDQTPLVENLLDQVAYLREQLAEEREARRRADTVIAQLTSRIPQLEAPRDEQEPPSGAAPRSDEGMMGTQGPEEATQRPRRGLWRRIFGS